MNIRINTIGFLTITRKELVRQFRIWPQTFLPPVITMMLYFLIFGELIGKRIGNISSFTYMQYITPGLVMMSIVTNCYANVSTSVYGNKFVRSIDEMLISPLSNLTILCGFLFGGILRGLITGALVLVVSLFFTHLQIHHIFILFTISFLTALMFSLGGFINGILANKFDDVMIIPTFVLTPLTYLGGVFFTINMLPPLWRKIALLNPILYMINASRFGMHGISDISIVTAFVIIVSFILVLFIVCLHLLERGIGLKS